MRSPAAAIAWEFRRQHRWGLRAVIGCLLLLATIKLLILTQGHRVDLDDAQTFALVVVIPLAATFMYFLAVFSFGLAGDLAARESIYPARMFTLPMSTAALVGWPMLYGTSAMAMLWFAMRLVGVWPSDIDVPIVWPAPLAASFVAWTQALTWMPYPLRGLRVIVIVPLMTVIDAIVMIALETKASEAVMLAILAPHVPLAYLAARFAVTRARRGDVPDWRRILAPFGTIANFLANRRKDFLSPARAQTWFEWRLHGRSLPSMVAIVVPIELSLLFVFSETPVIVFEVLVGVLLTPPFMAAFVAATVSKSSSSASDSDGMTPFIATRPVTNVALIAAKLKVTIWSTLAAWLLVLAVVPLALRLSGTLPFVIDWARELIVGVGKPRALAIVLLGFAALIASTWKQLVQSLYIGMSGREWIVKGSVFLVLSFLAIVFPVGYWVLSNKRVIAALWNALPWIAAVLVCLKIFAAARIAMRLYDNRLLSDRTLVIGAACWSVTVFALYGVIAWIVPALLVRSYLVALIAILFIPLARLSAAPLALAWNRHR